VRTPGRADLLHSGAAAPLPPLAAAEENWATRLREERLAAVGG
jgi:hypothetical protein